MRRPRPCVALVAAAAVSLAAASAEARDVEIEIPVSVPTLQALNAFLAVGEEGKADVSLQLAYDARGRISAGGACTVDGNPVLVSGRVRAARTSSTYVLTLRGTVDSTRITLKGQLLSDVVPVSMTYRGPLGRARGSRTAKQTIGGPGLARVRVSFDEGPDGLVLGRRGSLSGTGTVTSPYGNVPTEAVPVRGTLRNGRLSWSVGAGSARVSFQGRRVGEDHVGRLTYRLPPASGAIAGFTVPGLGAAGPGSGNATARALRALGVDVSPSPRIDDQGGDLPEEFAPLGACTTLNRTDELWVASFANGSAPATLSLQGFDVNGNAGALASPAPASFPWLAQTSVAAFASADVDGDGFGETLAFHFVGTTLTVQVFDDAQAAFAEATYSLGTRTGVLRMAAVDGDFDGNGVPEIALGLCRADDAEILFLGWSAGAIRQITTTTRTVARTLTPVELYLVMRTGNVDHDRADELAVVLNELADDDGAAATTARSRWFLWDDAAAGYALLGSDDVRGDAGGPRTALVSGMDLGDVDGDGLDEIVLGGYTQLANPGSTNVQPMLTVALDDAVHGLAPLGAKWRSVGSWIKSPSNSPWRIRFVHVNAADLDGDGAAEVHANQFVFEDFRGHAPWTDLVEIPYEEFFRDLDDLGARFRQETTQMVAADVLGDGRESIVMCIPWKGRVSVFGIDPLTGWKRRGTFAVQSSAPSSLRRLVLLPANVDKDSPVLRYDEASYELVFTQPVLIAAMAAPPTWSGRGQNVSASSTTFGTATSIGVDAELVFSVRAGSIVGSEFEVPLIGVGAEVEKTVQAEVSVFAGAGYRLEEAVFYKGGSAEDSVVFTSVPYDVWTYTIVSHPDPAAVGGKVTVALPRPPVTRKVSRDFYNAHVEDGAPHVDGNVFVHTIGDPRTYSTPSDRDQLLGPLGLFGLKSARRSVGQGTGSLGVSLEVSTEVSAGGSLEMSYDLRANTTGPAKLGMSVGASVSASLRVTSGSSTTYAAEIGDLPASTFASSSYDWGLFTYVHRSGPQHFQVLDYWTENFAQGQ